MPKYFDVAAIKKDLPDYAHEGDPNYGDSVFARTMLAELDKPHDGPTDGQHVNDCFNDALAGILDGLALRIPPGQMRSVVEHLLQHAAFTMRWKAQIEDDNYKTNEAKRQEEICLLGLEGRETLHKFLGLDA
jgi:hypothetical protein